MRAPLFPNNLYKKTLFSLSVKLSVPACLSATGRPRLSAIGGGREYLFIN